MERQGRRNVKLFKITQFKFVKVNVWNEIPISLIVPHLKKLLLKISWLSSIAFIRPWTKHVPWNMGECESRGNTESCHRPLVVLRASGQLGRLHQTTARCECSAIGSSSSIILERNNLPQGFSLALVRTWDTVCIPYLHALVPIVWTHLKFAQFGR